MNESKITKFTRKNSSALSQDAIFCLNLLEEKYGVRFSFKGMKFNEDCATISFECGLIKTDNSVVSRYEVVFRKYATSYGMEPSDVGRIFSYDGRKYKLLGLNRSNKRRPMVCELVGFNGPKISLAADSVRKSLQVFSMSIAP